MQNAHAVLVRNLVLVIWRFCRPEVFSHLAFGAAVRSDFVAKQIVSVCVCVCVCVCVFGVVAHLRVALLRVAGAGVTSVGDRLCTDRYGIIPTRQA